MTAQLRIAKVVRLLEDAASHDERCAVGRSLSDAQRIEFFQHGTPDQHEAYKHFVWQGANQNDATYHEAFRAAEMRARLFTEQRCAKIEAAGFDGADAAAQLRALEPEFDPTCTRFLIVGIDRSQRRGTRHEEFTLDEMRTTVPAMQKAGYDVFVAVHAFDGPRRARDHVLALRAFFVDLDLGKEAAFRQGSMRLRYARILVLLKRLRPDLIVSSGNGLHVYWTIPRDDPAATDANLWSERECQFVEVFKADPAVKDPARVLRLAGSLNLKDRDNPKRCHVIYRSSSHLAACARALDVTSATSSNRSNADASASRQEPARPTMRTHRRPADADPRAELILSRLEDVRGPRRLPSETAWLCRCPNPEHQDRHPSFVVLLKLDGSIRLHCRSQCTSMRTGEWLAELGLPGELSETFTQLQERNGWYAKVAPNECVVGNPSVPLFLRRLEQMGLEPFQFNAAMAAWAFFCPRSQLDIEAEIDADSGEVTPGALDDPRAAPLARMLLGLDGRVHLRCSCAVCTEQSRSKPHGLSAQQKLFEVIGLPLRAVNPHSGPPTSARSNVALARPGVARTDARTDAVFMSGAAPSKTTAIDEPRIHRLLGR